MLLLNILTPTITAICQLAPDFLVNLSRLFLVGPQGAWKIWSGDKTNWYQNSCEWIIRGTTGFASDICSCDIVLWQTSTYSLREQFMADMNIMWCYWWQFCIVVCSYRIGTTTRLSCGNMGKQFAAYCKLTMIHPFQANVVSPFYVLSSYIGSFQSLKYMYLVVSIFWLCF